MSDPDIGFRLLAAAAALWQLVLVVAGVGLWFLGEALIARLARRQVEAGRRGRGDTPLRIAGFALGTTVSLSLLLGFLGLIIWSFAGFWSFPDLLPDQFTPAQLDAPPHGQSGRIGGNRADRGRLCHHRDDPDHWLP